ncbi:MAG: hypothetical protein WBF93_00945 [Pirellulales bacterium]
MRFSLVLTLLCWLPAAGLLASDLNVGAAAVNLQADDRMVIAGSIGPKFAQGQEGELRVTAVVIEKPGQTKLAIVSCDVLFVTREDADPALQEIENKIGIPVDHILVSATHTHHAPSTATLHGYGRHEEFCLRLRRGIVEAVALANERLKNCPADFYFHLSEEKTIGANSRRLLSDGMIYWTGPLEKESKPTGPFDPQLPILAFREGAGPLRGLIYNHSTHTIGTRRPGVRSPSFYGLAAQELEAELGGTVCFLQGASGSTHNLGGVSTDQAVRILKSVLRDGLSRAQSRPVGKLQAIKQRFVFKVRTFDEAEEDRKVVDYCRKWLPQQADAYIRVFREMRRQLKPLQAEQRETWLQAIAIGDVAVVGVPAEYFTGLGVELKQRSPFPHTVVAELANDWIGYLPDREAHLLGGYQTWMGLHSYAEPGTGERLARELLEMLAKLSQAAGNDQDQSSPR